MGYDFSQIKNMPINFDGGFRNWLTRIALYRLIRRVNRGQALTRYLPKNHFASVRVIRSPSAMIIFARLILENPHLADEIYFYDESEQDILISDLTVKKEPHLIITFGGNFDIDEFLISVAEKKGISYGKRIVSFWREYINSCEKLFHNLGK